MPIAKYFFYVGAVLLGLLFGVDAFAPKETAASSIVAVAEPQANPTLRIRSDHKWPERVVYDTSLPTIVPPPVEVAAVAVAPAPVAEVPAKAAVRESFAQLGPAEPEAKPIRKRKVAKARAAPSVPPMRIAEQPQFGFFARNIW